MTTRYYSYNVSGWTNTQVAIVRDEEDEIRLLAPDDQVSGLQQISEKEYFRIVTSWKN